MASPVYFGRVAVRSASRNVATLPLGADGFDETAASHLQQEGTSWGDAVEWQGRATRPMQNFGSPFHKVAGVLTMDPEAAGDVVVRGSGLIGSGTIALAQGEWDARQA